MGQLFLLCHTGHRAQEGIQVQATSQPMPAWTWSFSDRLMRTGRPPQKPIKRFMSKVRKDAVTGCWIWTGCRMRRYGCFRMEPRNVRAHRWIYQYVNDITLDREQYVCHTCDNPICVNPDHLWVGTAQQNSSDMVRKGRSRKGLPRIRYT